MGPPPFDGGNCLVHQSHFEIGVGLQWGHRLSTVEITFTAIVVLETGIGFNGATAFRRWKYVSNPLTHPARQPASMGPPPFDGGNSGGCSHAAVASLASMGPPPFDGGNRTIEDRSLHDPDASMGPPPFDGGNLIGAMDTASTATQLQWGHRLSTVEMGLGPSVLCQTIVLQWGHRLSTVEMSQTVEVSRHLFVLQWGHRLSTVEIPQG